MTIVEETAKKSSGKLTATSEYLKQREEFYLKNKMLAHQRLPVNLEYLPPHITTSESKASPLALLAATCSSIGKTDNDKKEVRTTPSILSKLTMREEENKSSFKPYKFDVKPSTHRSSPPTLTSNIPAKTTAIVSSIFQNRLQTTMSVSEAERTIPRSLAELHSRDNNKEHFPSKCHGSSPPLPHLPHKLPMISPHRHEHHGDCTQCKPMRSHTEPLPMRPSTLPGAPPCPCPSCAHSRDVKCHYPPHPQAGNPIYSTYKTPPGQPIACRDPGCTNCSKLPIPPPHGNVQNFLHPALVHQCTHGNPHKPLYQPPPHSTHLTAYDSYAKPPTNTGKPFVCNWVAEGKHCGMNFVTSEELFQHLRTHTSLQQQQQNNCEVRPPLSTTTTPPVSSPNGCNILGCPCGQRKTSPRPTIPGYPYGVGSSPVRYSPYNKPGHSYAVPPPPSHHVPFHY